MTAPWNYDDSLDRAWEHHCDETGIDYDDPSRGDWCADEIERAAGWRGEQQIARAEFDRLAS